MPEEQKREWSAEQKAVINHRESALIVGMAGSGKTTLLFEKAVRLTGAGKKVALTTFAYRGLEYLKSYAQGNYPKLTAQVIAGNLQVETLKDLAGKQLEAAGQKFAFASNNQMREVMRAIMAEQSFTGTLQEAEHIIRSAKSRAKKLPENDRHYGFVMAYKQKMDGFGLIDRHDVVRRHVIGMKEGTVPPLGVSHILLDNLTDATELQLIWLQMHLNAGIHLVLAADDDTTAFGRDGALGAEAITQVTDWPDMTRFDLPVTYRLARNITPPVVKLARQLRNRVDKGENSLGVVNAELRMEGFPTLAAEHQYLTHTVSQLLAQAQGLRGTPAGGAIGILTRDDFTATLITHVLRKAGVNPASFARLMWENPTPQLVLSMLYVFLGQANNAHLNLVLTGFGLPPSTVAALFGQGLSAEGWLVRGCPLPAIEGLSPTLQAAAQKMRRAFAGGWQLMQAKTLTPNQIFKSLVTELLTELPESEHAQALLATDTLLSLSGRLTEILPRVMQETLPDMTSPITVAPVREVRNMEFSTVIIPHAGAGNWPQPPHTLLGPSPDHERRLFYLAMTRSRGSVLLTWHTPQPSPFMVEMQQSLKQQAKKTETSEARAAR